MRLAKIDIRWARHPGGLLALAAIAFGVALALGATALRAPAAAGPPSSIKLSKPGQRIKWQGSKFVNSTSPPTPEACDAVGCDELTLQIALPRNVWRRNPGGVQVGIRWHDPEEAQDLDLFVYGPDGELAARSDGFFASVGEQLILRRAKNGPYRVVVVPRNTGEKGLSYVGLVEVERRSKPKPRRRLLPDLVALRPRNLRFSIGGYLTNPAASLPEALGGTVSQLQASTNCYPEEVAEQDARRCLRFDQIIANVGKGTFELRYRMEGADDDRQLRQRIYRTDGSHYDRVADSYTFHAAHAHFHYRNFAQSRLWRASADGRRAGRKPVRVGLKNGFCMIDVENVWFGRKGDWIRAYYFPRCNTPTEQDPSGTYMVNGISPGWADVYNWYLADQYIEISGVPDGCYVLQTTADAKNTIVEAKDRNNSSTGLIRLEGDRARFVRRSQARRVCG